MKRLRKSGLMVLVAASLMGCGKSGQAHSIQEKEWKTEVVSLKELSYSNRYSAAIQGRQDVEIRPQVSGVIIEVRVTEGQEVKKDQVLFVIDQVAFQALLDQAIADAQVAEVAVTTAQLVFDTKQLLFEQKVISEYEYLMAQNELLRAQAQLLQQRAAVVKARNDLSFTEVKSPSDGVVGNIPYRQGALVNSAMLQPLTTVSDNSEVYVYFSLSEHQTLALMREWGSLKAMLEHLDQVELELSDGSLYPYKGKVESMSGVIDQNTGSILLRAMFKNPDRMLMSGATGNVLIRSVERNCMVIPQSATVRLQDKYMVYKVVHGIAESAQISVATENDGKHFRVLSGLLEGDCIVADGAGLVRAGMRIKNEE